MGEKEELTEQIIGAAIEVYFDFRCLQLVDGINRNSL